MTRQRLQKLIAAAGLCSRRRAEEWLQAGRVTVDGQVARVGDQADPQQQTIHVDGQPLPSPGVARVLLMNKPVGVICSCDDPQGRRTVLDLLPPEHRAGLHPVGRLDADSHGALLLTDLGELTLKLTHPRYSHAKTYRVWVQGVPPEPVLDHWRRGLPLDGRLTRPLGCAGCGPGVTARFWKLSCGKGATDRSAGWRKPWAIRCWTYLSLIHISEPTRPY